MTLSLSMFGKQLLTATRGSLMNAKTGSLMPPWHHLLIAVTKRYLAPHLCSQNWWRGSYKLQIF